VGLGSEFLRLEVRGKLLSCSANDGFGCGRRSGECVRGRIGIECCRASGVRFCMRWIRAPREFQFVGGGVTLPGKQVLRLVSAMSGSYTDAPSCIFVGPIETAEKARLEALYQQARDSYYSGQPLVVDDMFDKVEMQLRWHGSKLVLKYPRCSLKRFTAYADAEVDPSQMQALKTIWSLIFAVGFSLAVGLPTLVSTYMEFDPYEPGSFIMSHMNWMFLSIVSFLVGASVAQAAVKQLQALGKGDLVALKGCCPNCGEEVYTFVKPDHSSSKARHESECHICERQLIFQATLHPSKSGLGQPWAHGRVYLQTRANQLAPTSRTS
jgi:hypothetical protein